MRSLVCGFSAFVGFAGTTAAALVPTQDQSLQETAKLTLPHGSMFPFLIKIGFYR